MKYLRILALLAAFQLMYSAAEAGNKSNRLRLSGNETESGTWIVEVHVDNQRELAGLDIPLRFGRPGEPVNLIDVTFSERVADWDFTHAQIDNEANTVILGLISEVMGVRGNADLKTSAPGHTMIAELTLSSATEPEFSTFETRSPGHRLTFLFNEEDNGRLTVVEEDAGFEVQMSAAKSTLPARFALSQNYPNPFNPSTNFTLSLPEATDYTFRIFNVAGQLVKSMDGRAEAGEHTVTWDGHNDQGSSVASGAYFYRVVAGTFSETRRMMLLK